MVTGILSSASLGANQRCHDQTMVPPFLTATTALPLWMSLALTSTRGMHHHHHAWLLENEQGWQRQPRLLLHHLHQRWLRRGSSLSKGHLCCDLHDLGSYIRRRITCSGMADIRIWIRCPVLNGITINEWDEIMTRSRDNITVGCATICNRAALSRKVVRSRRKNLRRFDILQSVHLTLF